MCHKKAFCVFVFSYSSYTKTTCRCCSSNRTKPVPLQNSHDDSIIAGQQWAKGERFYSNSPSRVNTVTPATSQGLIYLSFLNIFHIEHKHKYSLFFLILTTNLTWQKENVWTFQVYMQMCCVCWWQCVRVGSS